MIGCVLSLNLKAEELLKNRQINAEDLRKPQKLAKLSEYFAKNELWMPSYLSNIFARKLAPESKVLFQNSLFLSKRLGLENGVSDLCGSNAWNIFHHWFFEVLIFLMSVFLCLWMCYFFQWLEPSGLKFVWVSGALTLFLAAFALYSHQISPGVLSVDKSALTYAQPTDVEEGGPTEERVYVVLGETPNWFKVHGLKNTTNIVWMKKSSGYFFESGQSICHDWSLSDK